MADGSIPPRGTDQPEGVAEVAVMLARMGPRRVLPGLDIPAKAQRNTDSLIPKVVRIIVRHVNVVSSKVRKKASI